MPSPHLLPHHSYVGSTGSPDVTRSHGSHNDGTNEVVDLFRTFQNSLDSKLQTVCDKLSDIDSRITIIETRQQSLEEVVRQSISSCSSTAGPASECDKRRKRVTPVVLQVNTYSIVASNYARFTVISAVIYVPSKTRLMKISSLLWKNHKCLYT